MAFTRAAQVADLVKRSVLPGVEISIGKSRRVEGIEVVVRGFQHPEDGMTRLWLIDLIGRSGMMLDLVIMGLRKAGFDMRGEAPIMRGVLTQVLTRAEVSQMRAKAREDERKKDAAQFQAKLQGETLAVQQHADEKIAQLYEEIDRLKEMIEDMALLPTPKGARGPAGPAGPPGRDGQLAELDDAVLADLGDVSREVPEERMVLTWSGGEWKPLEVPFRSINQIYGGGGGSGGGGGGQGPKGDPGLSAYEVAVNAGFQGTEQEWLDSLQGENGQTAYELAVEQGFVGTQEEWIESLRGEDGQDGTLTYWAEDENGHLIPADPCTNNLGSEANPVGQIYLCDGGVFFNGNQLTVTEEGNLIYNGAPVGGLTILERNREDMDAEPTVTVHHVTQLSFDTDSGFEVEDLGNGTHEAFIKLNSSFNPWIVDGSDDLDATGEEPVEFVGLNGISITTDATTDPKQIIFDVDGSVHDHCITDLCDVDTTINPPLTGQVLQWNGTNWVPGVYSEGNAFPDAPMDGRYWVRSDGQWIELSCALKAMMIGDGGQFSPEGDGGNFTTGYTGTWTDRTPYDGSDVTDGTTDAINNDHLDGQYVYSPYGEGGDFTHDDANGDSTAVIEDSRAYDGGNFTSGEGPGSCDGLDGQYIGWDGDGGDFRTGTSAAPDSDGYDGGDFTTGEVDAEADSGVEDFPLDGGTLGDYVDPGEEP